MRNARTYLLVAIGGVLFFTVFLLYVYNGAKGELAEAQKELDDYHKRFMRLTNELKGACDGIAVATELFIDLFLHGNSTMQG